MKKLILGLVLMLGGCFAQTPTVRPEPTATSYDVSELSLFPTYTAASYQTAFGQVPAFDVTRAPKFWFDSTVNSGTKTYQVLSGLTYSTITLSATETSTVNIPVSPAFPPVFVVVDDGVKFTGWADLDTYLQESLNQAETQALNNGGTATTPSGALTPIKASAIMGTVAGAAQYLCSVQNGNNTIFHGGVDPNCSNPTPLVNKYTALANTWAQAAAKVQTLLGSVPGTPCLYCAASALAPVQMPVRALYPNEQVQVAGLMGGVIVTQTTPITGTSDFTTTDRATLNQILTIVQGLK